MMKVEQIRYEAYGSVRGACGHKHLTLEAAQKCADDDARAISRCYPSKFPTHAYSDRYPRAI